MISVDYFCHFCFQCWIPTTDCNRLMSNSWLAFDCVQLCLPSSICSTSQIPRRRIGLLNSSWFCLPCLVQRRLLYNQRRFLNLFTVTDGKFCEQRSLLTWEEGSAFVQMFSSALNNLCWYQSLTSVRVFSKLWQPETLKHWKSREDGICFHSPAESLVYDRLTNTFLL